MLGFVMIFRSCVDISCSNDFLILTQQRDCTGSSSIKSSIASRLPSSNNFPIVLFIFQRKIAKMQVSNTNDVKVYSITSASKSALPDWLAKTNKKSLQRDIEWRNRIEIIQDFEFPEASLRLKSTRDGNHLMATGVYKPQMRVYELADLAMKFDRHTDAENVQFEILSDDWTKSIHLQNDRSIEFHTQFGMHYKTRIPKFGRDMSYHYPSCDLLIGGDSNEIWRLNLEQGKFMNSLNTDLPAVNTCSINPAHQLWAFGGENGKIEFWHPTQRKRIAGLDLTHFVENVDSFEISALEFADDGLIFSVGVSTGQVLMFDLRRPTPLLIKDHQYGYPIKSIKYHDSGNVISADTKIVKFWDKNTGKSFTSIEPPNDINDILIEKDSGLLMVANEGVRIETYYIPQLGPAPKWCPFLDNMTEELEENPSQVIYDDYKFVTRKELNQLGLDNLVGTNVLRAYMHGFFVDLRLYEKARSVANPFDYQEYKKNKIRDTIQKKQASRISASKVKLPKINKAFADQLLNSTSDGSKKKKNEIVRENATTSNPLGDDRFGGMFEDDDFEVDFTSAEYKLRYPTEAKKTLASNFERIEEEEEDEPAEESDAMDEDEEKPTNHQPKFYELKSDLKNLTSSKPSAALPDIKLPFEQRINNSNNTYSNTLTKKSSGNMSVQFKPGRGGRRNNDDSDDDQGDQRGVRDLGMDGRSGRGRGRGALRGGSRGGRGAIGRGGSRGGRGGGGRGGPRGSSSRGRGRGGRV